MHQSAIVTKPVGHLDRNELDALGRRLAKFLDIDLGPEIQAGINERWDEIVEARKVRKERS